MALDTMSPPIDVLSIAGAWESMAVGTNRAWLRKAMDRSDQYRRKSQLLADDAGVARQTISGILNGKGEDATKETLAKLADALKCGLPGEGEVPDVVPSGPIGKVRAAIGLLSEAAREMDAELRAAASAERQAKLQEMKQGSRQPASGKPAKKRRHG